LFLPLLALLLLGASAAATSPERAVHDARNAINRGDLAAAEAILDDALARFGSRTTEDVYALRVMRGEVHAGRREWDAASKALAFEMPQSLRTSETAFQHVVMRAFALKNTGHRDKARELVDAAMKLAAAHRPAALADLTFVLTGLEPADAEKHARESIRLARKYGRKSIEAKAMAALAFSLARSERFVEAVHWGEQGVTLARAIGIAKTTEQVEGNLGWAYRELGDSEVAADLFRSAEARARRMGANAARVPWLIQLGNIAEEQRDWARAKAFNEEAASIARETKHRDLGYALANLARIAIATGRFDDARRLNAEALANKKGDREAELRSYILEAHMLIAERKLDAAAKLLDVVLKETGRDLTGIEARGELAQLHARANRRTLAEEQFRRAVESAGNARADVKEEDLRLSIGNNTRELFGQYVDFLVQSGRIEDALAIAERSRAQTLEEGLTVPAKLDARAVARQNDATILSYWLGRDRSYLWVITEHEVALHNLPPDTTVETAAEGYQRELVNPQGSLQRSGARGQALFDMLVRPALPSIAKGSRVIVVADGKLHALNFETLVAPSPRRYWIEDVVLMNANSLQLLARTPRKRTQAPSMLLVGNAPTVDPRFRALAFAGAEMRAIEKRFPRRTVLEGAKATPSAYESSSPEQFDYVHFVAHGETTRKRPLDSAVILGRDANARYKLLARDVMQHPLTARLVTISSCHGVGERTYAGEGVIGLAWAFLRAGADQVIAALWVANDATTPQLMERMYAGIGAGKDPAVALREAKLTLLRAPGPQRRPFYWAPFVLYAGT
jgi:CHAT domain-containing protein